MPKNIFIDFMGFVPISMCLVFNIQLSLLKIKYEILYQNLLIRKLAGFQAWSFSGGEVVFDVHVSTNYLLIVQGILEAFLFP